MISTQRKILIIQTKRKYKKIEKQVIEHKDEEGHRLKIVALMMKAVKDKSTKSEDDVDSAK